MRFTKLGIALIFLPFVCGCLYSVEFKPPYEPIDITIPQPLDLSVSLLDITSCFLDTCRVRKKSEIDKVDDAFVELMQAENLFASVQPIGAETDIFVEFIHYPDIDNDITKKEAFRRDFLTATGLGFITPIPYPLYIETKGIVRLSTNIEDQEYILREYDFIFKSTIKAASVFGARYKRKELLRRGVGYVMPILADYIKLDYEFLKNASDAIHSHDHDLIKELSLPEVKRLS